MVLLYTQKKKWVVDQGSVCPSMCLFFFCRCLFRAVATNMKVELSSRFLGAWVTFQWLFDLCRYTPLGRHAIAESTPISVLFLDQFAVFYYTKWEQGFVELKVQCLCVAQWGLRINDEKCFCFSFSLFHGALLNLFYTKNLLSNARKLVAQLADPVVSTDLDFAFCRGTYLQAALKSVLNKRQPVKRRVTKKDKQPLKPL